MQTLILINPVATPPRAEGLAPDSGTPESPDAGFADLMAGVGDGLPATDPTETASVAAISVVPPETVLPFRFDPMGAVRGLAEAAAMPNNASEGDLPGLDTLRTNTPPPKDLSTDLVRGVVAPADHLVDLAPVASMGIILPPRLPEDAAYSTENPEIHGFSSLNLLDRRPSTASASGLLLPPVSAESSPPTTAVFRNNLPDRPAAKAAGTVKSSNLALTMQPPPPAETSADGASNFDGGVAPANAEHVKGVSVDAMAKLAVPAILTAAPASGAGAELLWQAGLMAGMDQSDPAEPPTGTDPVAATTDIRDPSAAPFRVEGQVSPAFRWGEGLVAALSALGQLDDPDGELGVGAMLASGALPTYSSTLGGIGHPSAPVSLQELPRLAAQLAGTLVHRADGQTDVALSPEELGHVRLTMQADAQNPDRMVVMLTFERPETLDLFRRHTDQLAEALREAGYSGADISFGRSGGESAGTGADRDAPAAVQQDLVLSDRDITALPSPSRPAATGSLDLRL